MRWIIYTLLAYILIAGSNEHPFAPAVIYGEEAPITDKEFSGVNAVEEAEEEAKEIRIKKDEFDEIVGQLQGMKAFLESMKHDYDTRFKEMQEKIAVLEKENTELKITQLEPVGAIHELPLPKTGNTLAVGEVNSKTQKVSDTNEEEKPIASQMGENSRSPLHDTFATNQPMSSGSGQWSPAQPPTLWSMGKSYMNISFDGLFSAAAQLLRIWKI